MRPLLRAIAGFAAYLGLVLLPLATALSSLGPGTQPFASRLGVACGYIALAMLALEFALVTRSRAVVQPFGIDALQGFHRRLGIAGAGFALAHPLLLLAGGMPVAWLDPVGGPDAMRPGIVALGLLAVLLATTWWRRRLRLSYEAWLRIHRWTALGLLAGALAHAFALDAGHDGALRIAWTGYALLVLALLVRHRLLAPWRASRRPWQVVAQRRERADTCTLVLEPAGHRGLDFEPGQFAWLLTGRSAFGALQHPVTISSSAEQDARRRLEFTIKALGDWSRERVPQLVPGTRLWIDGPYGSFTPEREPALGLVLVAGGVGITPMRSILLTMRDRGDRRPVLLIHAASTFDRLTFREEIEALRAELALRVVHVLEQPPEGWTGERGYIDAALLQRHLPAGVAHWQCFVCGPPAMLDAMERLLPACGVPADRIHTERFAMV
jgi:predicted ferric reductase